MNHSALRKRCFTAWKEQLQCPKAAGQRMQQLLTRRLVQIPQFLDKRGLWIKADQCVSAVGDKQPPLFKIPVLVQNGFPVLWGTDDPHIIPSETGLVNGIKRCQGGCFIEMSETPCIRHSAFIQKVGKPVTVFEINIRFGRNQGGNHRPVLIKLVKGPSHQRVHTALSAELGEGAHPRGSSL